MQRCGTFSNYWIRLTSTPLCLGSLTGLGFATALALVNQDKNTQAYQNGRIRLQ